MVWNREAIYSGRHGGDIYRNQICHDYSVNLNPLGMPREVREALLYSIDGWGRYPDPRCEKLKEALAVHHKVNVSQLICGNGAADLIFQAVQALKPKKALLLAPTFSEYEKALQAMGTVCSFFSLSEKKDFSPDMDQLCHAVTEDLDLVFFCNPNNPTGSVVERKQVERLARACGEKGVRFILDECFCDLLEQPERVSMVPLTDKYPGMFILRAFTKTYAMAGLRLGYGVCSDEEFISRMEQARQPWSVSVPAQVAGEAALNGEEYLQQARSLIAGERIFLRAGLECFGYKVYDSAANYLLFYNRAEACHSDFSAGHLWEMCRKRGVLLRDCSDFRGLGIGFYRVCVGRREENRLLLDILGNIAGDEKKESMP